MSNFDEQDDISSLNRKDTENNLPIGWVIFFIALIVWGIFYLYKYTPMFSSWTQNGAYEEQHNTIKDMLSTNGIKLKESGN